MEDVRSEMFKLSQEVHLGRFTALAYKRTAPKEDNWAIVGSAAQVLQMDLLVGAVIAARSSGTWTGPPLLVDAFEMHFTIRSWGPKAPLMMHVTFPQSQRCMGLIGEV